MAVGVTVPVAVPVTVVVAVPVRVGVTVRVAVAVTVLVTVPGMMTPPPPVPVGVGVAVTTQGQHVVAGVVVGAVVDPGWPGVVRVQPAQSANATSTASTIISLPVRFMPDHTSGGEYKRGARSGAGRPV